ncbi:MAG TPA: maleylpyruvate isomerase family mycothiol-dependent enzyme [Candidatus Limnocylindrales bacterium]|nr:maleylpyruvate isomerase family mycothiol-dependent enzyme [Candidatus Limnocylindrales bacterium]
MDIRTHIQAVDDEGRRLADSVVDFDAAVPTCPDWTVRDLVRHLGEVHAWARSHVTDLRQERNDDVSTFRTWPAHDDAALIDWYRNGHAALVEALEKADPGADFFGFLPGWRGTRFWARRQAHETAMHRVDAQSVSGAITATTTEFAVDGIDEMLHGFFARRPSRLVSEPPLPFVLRANDAGRSWSVTIGADGVTTVDEGAEGLASVSGTAFDLYLLLWNRRELEGLEVQGDPAGLALWRETAKVQWGF